MAEETIIAAEPSPVDPIKAHFEEWQKTVHPQPKPQEPAPVDAPKAEITEDDKSEIAPDPVAGKEPMQEKRPGSKLSAEERISQLVAKTKQQEQELKELRESRTKPAEPSPAPKTELKPAPEPPNAFAWTGTAEEYEAALRKYNADFRAYLAEDIERGILEKQQKEAEQRQLAQTQEAWGNREKEARETVENYDELVEPVKELIGKAHPSRSNFVFEYVIKYGGPEMLVHFAQNPGDLTKVLNTPDARAMDRELNRIAFTLDSAKSSQKDPEPKVVKPPAPPETRASKPPSEVGGRSASPPDALEAATRRRDYTAFAQEATRRYVEKRK